MAAIRQPPPADQPTAGASTYTPAITPDADDQTLVVAAQAGDQQALDALLRRHIDRVHSVCRRMTGNESDAQDATQEALLAIVKGLPRFDGRAKFSTWAYRVATNACLDELRRRRRRPAPVEEIFEDADPSGPPGIADTISDRLLLDDALADLAPEYRSAVVLRDVLGLDYAEISEVLDIAPGTVRSRIARGRAGLARTLTTGNQEPTPNVSTEVPR